jgi:FixJ family two-component response regulator
MDGTEVLAQLAERENKWPVIMLTGHGDVRTAVNSLKLGAYDFLEKPVRSEELFKAIENAFSHFYTQVAVERRQAEARRRVAALTPRELEVVCCLSGGSSNKQVAFDLSLSPRTVEMHRANGFRHLQVRTLVEAAALLADASIMTSTTRSPKDFKKRKLSDM